MSATVMNLPVSESQTAKSTEDQDRVELVKCYCCGLTEECTVAYIEQIRERYKGKWICGLCGEAIKDEVVRSERLISTEEALNKHIAFRKMFAGPPPNPEAHLISAIRQILRRSISLPRSMPSSPTKRMVDHAVLMRSESCIPAPSLADEVAKEGKEL